MPSSLLTDDLWTRLIALREYTARHGVLVEAQLEQLKLWAALAFQQVARKDIEIRVDFENRLVVYALTGGKLAPLKTQAMLVAGLDRSVHALLGDEWKLAIEHGGKRIYEGRAVPRAEKTNDRRAEHRARTRRNASRR